MNLGFDPWIPVTYRDGTQRNVSLAEAFVDGRDIADLTVRPHERIALMRLLVCVAQAAMEGPQDEYGWTEAEEKVQPKVADYLEKWKNRFELFGDGPRFLQAKVDKMSEFETSKLLFHRACGNNATLFDHEGGLERKLAPPELAIALLCFQNMSAPIGAGYTGKPPCLDRHFLQTWIIGENLLATTLANGVDCETVQKNHPGGFGRPIWESDNSFYEEDFVQSTTLSFLGRLVPTTRCIWLNANGMTFQMAKPGIKHPMFEEYREAAATVLVNEKKGERNLLTATLEKQPWRDLQNVFRSTTVQGTERPLPMERSEPAVFKKLWLGALITDGKGKYEDVVEAVYDVPRELLSVDHCAVYEAGISLADQEANKLQCAVNEYVVCLEKAEKNRVRRMKEILKGLTQRGERYFWNTLDQHVHLLFDAVRVLGTPAFPEADDCWSTECKQAALAAYLHTCAAETPRQIQAHAAGLKRLRFSKKKTQPKKK